MLSNVPLNTKVLFSLTNLILALGWCACAKKQTNVERGIENGELYIGIGAEPAALDPHLTTGLTEYSVMLALLEGLTTLHPETMAVVPGVAQSWIISEDHKRYTFQFDPTARWSNGERVTPQDFIFSFKRILSPALGAPYAYMLYPMRGAEAYHRGQNTDFRNVGVSAPDEYTLVIELESPTPYFLSMLSHNTWWPVHPPTILKHGAITDRISKWTKAGNFVGNGPFLLKRWRLNNGIHVVRNPQYRARTEVALNGIHFLPIAIQSEERAFRAGHLHLTSSVPIHRIDWYRENQPERLRFDTALGVYYYMLNTEQGPLADIRVRQALAYSIDRKALTKYVLRAGQKPAFHFTPPNTGGYEARARLPLDPDLARKRLAEAGYPEGKGFPKLKLLFNTSESHRTLAVAIQQIWKKELGIEIELHNQEWKAYLATRQSGDFDILRAAWFGDYDDPNTFLSLGESDNGNNHTNWHDPRYDSLIEQAAKETDPATRMELFQEAEAILIEALPVIPIYFYVTSRLIHPAVKGWYPSLLDNHPYQAIQLKD
jgi:oligopeptide transport system substrate-binding protein